MCSDWNRLIQFFNIKMKIILKYPGFFLGTQGVNFHCPDVLIIWIIVGQGSAAVTVYAGGVVWTFLL